MIPVVPKAPSVTETVVPKAPSVTETTVSGPPSISTSLAVTSITVAGSGKTVDRWSFCGAGASLTETISISTSAGAEVSEPSLTVYSNVRSP